MRRIVVSIVVVVLWGVVLPAGAQVPVGGISGTVTADSTGDPLEGICVYGYGPGIFSYWDETDADGTYTLEAIEPGDYIVEFYDCNADEYVSEFYDDSASYEEADPVPVSITEPATDVDAALAEYGSITGTVTDETTGEGLSQICVQAVHQGSGSWWYGTWEDATTDGSGHYTIDRLRPGGFVVSFHDCRWPEEYRDEYYDDAAWHHEAEVVQVVEGGDTPDIDAALESIPPVPMPDLAVADLHVENVPLRTDGGEHGHTGWTRRVHVTIENLGEATSLYWDLYVTACAETTGLCRTVGWEYGYDLAAGDEADWSFTWNGVGQAGDVEVTAEVWGYDDVNGSNDRMSVHHYALIGGTGFGV